jgi:probable HAF family extracellular repeat protein
MVIINGVSRLLKAGSTPCLWTSHCGRMECRLQSVEPKNQAMKTNRSLNSRQILRMPRAILCMLAALIAGAPAVLLAQYSETNMLGGYNISPTAAASGGIFAGTASPGFQSATPVVYNPSTGWGGLPVGAGFVTSLYGINLNSWGAAIAVSHDGSVVAGSVTGTLTNGYQAGYAAYWVKGVESLVPTPPDDPTTTSLSVTAISGDGSTLVVQDYNNVPTYGRVASYLYRIASGTFTSLGFFPGTTNQQTYATAISKDGTIVAGYYALDNGDKHGFLWKAASGMTDIGIPASAAGAGFVYLQPACISDDGTTLFGTLSIGNGWGGFRYYTTTGFQDLGTFSPTACTADGSEAVGTKGPLNYAAIWSPGNGSGTVANLLSANGIAPGANGIAGPATISQDGSSMTAVVPNPISGEHYPTVTPILITLPVPLKTAPVPLSLLKFYTAYATALVEPAGTLSQYADFNNGASAVLVTKPRYASSFVLNADGSFSYTPKPGYISAAIDAENGNPPDTFSYCLKGPNGTSSNAVVQITVAAPAAPTVDTPTAINVTATTATLGGTVESDGGAAITGVGVVYAPTDLDSNPQIGDGVASTAVGTGATGAFTVNASGLTPATVYSYAAYATNSVGLSYSVSGSFATLATPKSWQQTWFGSPTNSGAALNADPYHTGVQNIAVFAFLGQYQDPSTVSPAQLPQVQISGGNLIYSFTEPYGVSGITYGALWSATRQPNDWHAVPDTGDLSATPPAHLFSVPMGTNAQLFMRLTVAVQ